jgi:hypothetical protein
VKVTQNTKKGIKDPGPKGQANEDKEHKFPTGPRYSFEAVVEPQYTGLEQKKNIF